MLELLDTSPAVAVDESEYRRLLGYPRGHEIGERGGELGRAARAWYAAHGRPWLYLREPTLEISGTTLHFDGQEFRSAKLLEHLQRTGAQRVLLVAVSAGAACENEAHRLWQEQKPDEYFFLEIFGSAVVEHLVASVSGRICELAERDGLIATPHYSPGYVGWDIADQARLLEVLAAKMAKPLPEPFGVLSSGMLRPKKSLLAVFGLTPRPIRAGELARLVPCESCAFQPCSYRRAAYRHAPIQLGALPASVRAGKGSAEPAPVAAEPAPLVLNARYSINPRALEKWAKERVRLAFHDDRSVDAVFRFDGTTCSNMGHPLAFEYRVKLSAPQERYVIRVAECAPVAGDVGHTKMCAFLEDSSALTAAIAGESPLIGRPLDDAITWDRPVRSAGCYCDRDSRLHKWGQALETIHFALVRAGGAAVARTNGAASNSPVSSLS